MRIRTTLAGTAVVAVMALTVGACGGSSKSSGAPSGTAPAPTSVSGAKTVLASVRTTAAAKTAHMSMTVGTDGSSAEAFSLTADGAIDFETGNSQFTANLGGAASAFLSGGLEMRIVDGVAYMKLPAGLGGLFGGGEGGDKWISIPAPAGAGSGANPFGGVGQSDPASFLSALGRVSDDVKEVGTETVRGVDTTHYHATLDLQKSINAADLPPGLRDKANALLGDAPAIPVDVFVDSDGRVRRMTIAIDLGSFMGGVAGASGATGLGDLPTMNVTVEFYDFGAPVNVAAPPADQIVQLPKLGDLGGLGDFGGLGGISGGAGAPNAGGAAA